MLDNIHSLVVKWAGIAPELILREDNVVVDALVGFGRQNLQLSLQRVGVALLVDGGCPSYGFCFLVSSFLLLFPFIVICVLVTA